MSTATGKRLLTLLVTTALAGLLVAGAWALEPVKEKQVVYGITAWTGKEYAGTFAPNVVDTIYLMHGRTNILNTWETEVYYWPITREFMADWFGYKEEVKAKLQVLKDGELVKEYEKRDYAFVYPEGYGGPVELVMDEAAIQAEAEHQEVWDAYNKASWEYYEAKNEWDQIMAQLLKEVRETGQPKKPEEIPPAPQQPEMPSLWVRKPDPAFLLEAEDLKPGRYQVQAIGEDGKVIEGTVRNLVIFDARREAVGYTIRPESEWTMPVASNDPAEKLYVYGKRTMFLLPFHAKEFDRMYYTRMTELHKPLAGQGMHRTYTWVQTTEVDGAKIELVRNGEVEQVIQKEPFYVQQTPGYALGYNIVKFDPEDEEMQGRQPNLWGYQLTVEGVHSYQMRAVDEDGNVMPGSLRELRSIKDVSPWSLYITALFPFAIGILLNLWRRKLKPRVSSTGETVGA